MMLLINCGLGTAGGAISAQAPVDHFGLTESEAEVVGRGKAGGLADRAVDVRDDAARAAHDVVEVVSDTAFETGRTPRQL